MIPTTSIRLLKCTLFVLLFVVWNPVYSQSPEIDQLNNALTDRNNSDATRVQLLIALNNNYRINNIEELELANELYQIGIKKEQDKSQRKLRLVIIFTSLVTLLLVIGLILGFQKIRNQNKLITSLTTKTELFKNTLII